MQWLKRYFDLNYNGEPYDAVGRRKGQDFYYIGQGIAKGIAKPAAKKPTTQAAPKISSGVGAKPKAVATGSKPQASSQKQEELSNELAELKLTSDTLEKERDFYFGKLRDIEVLLQAQNDETNPVIEMVMKILYATEDERVEIDEHGQLTIHGAEGAAQEEGAENGDEEEPS